MAWTSDDVDIWNDDIEIQSGPPANTDRVLECPLANSSETTFSLMGTRRQYKSFEEVDFQSSGWEGRVAGDWAAFNEGNLGVAGVNVNNGRENPSSVVENARVAALDVRLVNGRYYFYYLSNGTAFAPIEQWSSTKTLSVFLAGEYMRRSSQGQVGLNSWVKDKHVGEHITSIGSVSNNSTAAWFKTIMGATPMTQFIKDWMGKSSWDYYRNVATIDEDFRGRYGEAPANNGSVFTEASGNILEVNQDLSFTGPNTLSPLTMLESWKRVVVDEGRGIYPRDLSLTREDRSVLLYGEPSADNFGGFLLGGSKDAMMESFESLTKLNQRTAGAWRIFGKTGSGFSGTRKRYEGVYVASVCLPAAPGGMKETRQILFMVNVQAKSSTRRSALRTSVIRKIAESMVPEYFAKQ